MTRPASAPAAAVANLQEATAVAWVAIVAAADDAAAT